jgi:transposase
MAVAVRLREGVSGTELRCQAVRAKDANQARRLLALAAVADGISREQAARIGGMDRQTLRDWVHRFNAAGVAGLINARSPGRPPKLGPEQRAWLKGVVEKGPDLARDGVVRWRCVDLKRVVKERFDIDCDEDTIGRVLNRLGFAHISPRPQHPAQDKDVLAAFKKTSPTRWRPSLMA